MVATGSGLCSISLVSMPFLVPKSRDAAKRALKAIREGAKALAKHPESGPPVGDLSPEFREWVIEIGHGAYIAL
jgi:plasmid stabilization system protein ParE